MKIVTYNIVSDHSPTPLAQIRVVNGVFDLVVDNTNGRLPNVVGHEFGKLQRILQNSSHMRLEESSDPIPHVLRYVLSNGDMIEITDDGKTVVLNGELLQDDEKQDLFEAVKSGALQVDLTSDEARPATRPMPIEEAPEPTQDVSKINDATVKGFMDKHEELERKLERSNSNYDEQIEDGQYHTLDPQFTKALAYNLRYGLRKNSK